MVTDLDARLSRCVLADRDSLRRRARRLREQPGQAKRDKHRRSPRQRDPAPDERVSAVDPGGAARPESDPRWQALERAISASEALFEHRRSHIPKFEIPAQLPIAQHADEIVAAIVKHQVVIVSGDTGSGKSTQLSKLCLRAGRGVAGQIAHTQPRRMAARSVARRVAHELHQSVGECVGFKVRFDSHVRRESHIKVLTDGLLLAELGRDRQLRSYDTIIVDEAHERSLNVDFLLGYLKRLCRSRPELRVVISSATLDEERFSAFFDGAPVLRVSGRSYPVQLRYRPPQGEQSLAEQVRLAVSELAEEGTGDVLVFLSGEREIHEVATFLHRALGDSVDVLPLYARLPVARQERIFTAHSRRRVVLSTNIAETSLTVPGVRYVVDAGCARIGRYVPGSAVQHLPIESISKASARQRAGRCGREAPGVCIRLYGEEDFENFAEFTEPEILRTDLAAVLLRMHSLGVRDLRHFPLLDPPAKRRVNDGLRLLRELGALDDATQITTIGRQLARLPLDPRIGRMLLAGAQYGCVREVLIIASGLAAGDPRERSRDQRGPMPQQLRFEDERSDFLRLVKIWQYVQLHLRTPGDDGRKQSLSQICRRTRLSFVRMQEWLEVHWQLRVAARDMDLHANSQAASYASVHRALLSGLLRHVGSRLNEREYQGIRGNAFRISAGSGQSHRRVRWVLAAELVDAGTTWAHTVAGVRPEWVEHAAGALIRRTHFDAWWDARRAQPMVFEQTRLYSLTVTARRKIRFAGVSHEGAREVFIRGALVDGLWDTAAPVIREAWQWMDQRRTLEAKLRRPDPAINHERLYEFFDKGLPESVWDAACFEKWWPQADDEALRRLSPALGLASLLADRSAEPIAVPSHSDVDAESDLSSQFSVAMSSSVQVAQGGQAMQQLVDRDVVLADELAVLGRSYPDAIELPNARLPVSYSFAPGEDSDGISVHVPRALLSGVYEVDVVHAVPGLLREQAMAMLRGLPKSMRRRVGPIADAVQQFEHTPRLVNESLAASLSRFASTRYAVEVDAAFWSDAQVQAKIPVHLRVRYRLIDENGKELACSRDLDALKLKFLSAATQRAGAARVPREGAAAKLLPRQSEATDGAATRWIFGELAPREAIDTEGASGWVYPALHAEAQGVVVSQLDSEARARRVHARGLLRLAISCCDIDVTRLAKSIDGAEQLCLLNAMVSPTRPDGADDGDGKERPVARPGVEIVPLPVSPSGPCAQLLHDLTLSALQHSFDDGDDGWTIRDETRFAQWCRHGAQGVDDSLRSLTAEVRDILLLHRDARVALDGRWPSAFDENLADARAQLNALVSHGFLRTTSHAQRQHLPRYLQGVVLRLGKLHRGGANDTEKLQRLKSLRDRFVARARLHAREGRDDPMLTQYRWLLEEYRISLFAQELGTAQKVSKERLDRLWRQVPP